MADDRAFMAIFHPSSSRREIEKSLVELKLGNRPIHVLLSNAIPEGTIIVIPSIVDRELTPEDYFVCQNLKVSGTDPGPGKMVKEMVQG